MSGKDWVLQRPLTWKLVGDVCARSFATYNGVSRSLAWAAPVFHGLTVEIGIRTIALFHDARTVSPFLDRGLLAPGRLSLPDVAARWIDGMLDAVARELGYDPSSMAWTDMTTYSFGSTMIGELSDRLWVPRHPSDPPPWPTQEQARRATEEIHVWRALHEDLKPLRGLDADSTPAQQYALQRILFEVRSFEATLEEQYFGRPSRFAAAEAEAAEKARQ